MVILQEAAPRSVRLSSDLFKCFKLLFFPSYNCAFPQGEMPAPNTAHATPGLVTHCHWCPFVIRAESLRWCKLQRP